MKKQFTVLSALLLMLMLVDSPLMAKQRKAESIRRAVQKYVQSPVLVRDMENVSVYSGRQNGFVVVSKSENMPEVLGFGSERIDASDMPDGMKWLISYYNSVAAAVDAGKMNAPRIIRPPHAIEPLVKTTWDQDAPFWDMLPLVEDEETGEKDTVVVGCVATAVSQVMYYHKWPERGQGSVIWNSKVIGEMQADFSNSVYDWNNMLLNYGTNHEESKVATDAVALLCHDVSYACKSDFDSKKNSGTGSVAQHAAYALVHNFSYDKGLHIGVANHYSEEEWAAILYGELEAARPIQYYGMTGGARPAGHAFILDGINEEGFYHVNWGWRGKSNNYFLLSTLDPDDPGIGSGGAGKGKGYCYSQQAILGIQKPVEGSVYRPYVIETHCKPMHIAMDRNFTEILCLTSNVGYDTFDGYYTCKPVNAETGEEIDIVLFKADKVQAPTGSEQSIDTLSANYSGVIPDGKYYFRIYTTDKDGYTTHCTMADSLQSQMFEVHDNKLYYISNGIEVRNIKYSNIVSEESYLSFRIEYDVVNTSNASVNAEDIGFRVNSEMEHFTIAITDTHREIKPGETIHFNNDVEVYGENETIQLLFVNTVDEFYYYRIPRMTIKEFVETAGIAPVIVTNATDSPSYSISGIPVKGNAKGIVISNGKKTIK